MTRILLRLPLVTGLMLLLNVMPSWGQPVCSAPGCNPTASDANQNTAGGTGALANVDEDGLSNTAFGDRALFSNTTGSNNTATGMSALSNNATGINNTAVGAAALAGNTTGSSNTGSGAGALHSNTTGINNTASGLVSLGDNTVGNNNTASGVSALESNTTGNLNTAAGFQALQLNSAGSDNTAVGAKALKKSTGTKNIGIGYQAGVTLQMGNNNIYIGNQGVGDESQTIRIGTAQAQTFIAGINTAGVSGATVTVDAATGQLGITPSSVRYKRDIIPMGSRSERVLDLRPVTFAYRDDAEGVEHYGLLAEDVASVYPQLVTRSATGEVVTVKYQELIPMLLNELQRQRHELTALPDLRRQLERQQQELTELRALVGQPSN